MKFLSDSFTVRYDDALKSIVIVHPDKDELQSPLVQIRQATYTNMSFKELAEFLGARLLLLMPTMRAHFKEEIDRMNEQP